MARIVIALDPGAAGFGGLELVRHLSPDGSAELLCLLIEDAAVVEHARSRLAREVLLSGVERQLEAKALEKQIRAQTASARARFERAAGQLGLHHAFHVMRGEMISELIKSASGAQTLIVDVRTIHQHVSFAASIARLIAVPIPGLLFAKERWSSGAGIVAVVEDEASADAVLAAALPLATRSGSPVTVLLASRRTATAAGAETGAGAATEAATGAATEAGAAPEAGGSVEATADRGLLDRIATIYGAHGREPDPIVTAEPDRSAGIVRAAERARAGLIVMRRRERAEEATVVAELLDNTASSLLLVS